MAKLRAIGWVNLAALVVGFVAGSPAFSQGINAKDEPNQEVLSGTERAVIWVKLQSTAEVSKLQSGAVLDGTLDRAVYWRDCEVFPAGSRVRLVVDKVASQKKTLPDDRPWVIRLFAPRHESIPSFRSATITLSDGTGLPLMASFVRFSREEEIHASAPGEEVATGSGGGRETGKAPPGSNPKKGSGPPLLVLQVEPADSSFSTLAKEPPASAAAPGGTVTLAAGMRAPVVLLQGLSASRNRLGDSVQARLLQPVRLGPAVALPEGSLFQGTIVKRAPPRLLSRAGALSVSFTKLTLPGGGQSVIAASPTAVEVNEGSRMKMDSEGGLQGGSPGIKRLLIDVGVATLIAKVVDDSTQLIIEAVVSTATDASTAGTARLIAAGAAGLFLVTRHGRDVVLPQYTEMEVSFTRPLSLADGSPAKGPPEAQFGRERPVPKQ